MRNELSAAPQKEYEKSRFVLAGERINCGAEELRSEKITLGKLHYATHCAKNTLKVSLTICDLLTHVVIELAATAGFHPGFAFLTRRSALGHDTLSHRHEVRE